ncbi:MAG: hypothetical protein RQ745_01365 [Longimicrobiales bacterium]|nr:hypothetical protein [Longimicrobiales bacterium]
MSAPATAPRIAMVLAVFLGSLTLVAWRQGRALDLMGKVDSVRAAVSLEHAETDELQHRIQRLESRAWVVEQARVRLGMHRPDASEIRILSGGRP